jgi:hypothetical protein
VLITVQIQGPILNKDLNALSDQVEIVARQMTDRRTARNFQALAVQLRDLMLRRVKPLMKMQDELVYQLASLELYIQPMQHKVNQSLVHLLNIQYYIDNQGQKIGQLVSRLFFLPFLSIQRIYSSFDSSHYVRVSINYHG